MPVCNLDSFVYQAGAQAESIYGDEGINGKPQAFGFTESSRINAGFNGINDQGLTTGHASYMPDASGGDEFLMGPNGEWGPSGPGSGPYYASMPPGYDDGPPDTNQTKEMANSAAGSMGSGLLTVPVNGSLSLVWNPPALPNIGLSGGSGGVTIGVSLPGLPGLPMPPGIPPLPGLPF